MASHLGKVDLLFQGIRQLLQEAQLFRHDASACEQMSNIVLARGKGGTWQGGIVKQHVDCLVLNHLNPMRDA